jgi:hypothetical protein
MIGVFVGFLHIFVLGILIFKRLTGRRLRKSFGVTGLMYCIGSLKKYLYTVLYTTAKHSSMRLPFLQQGNGVLKNSKYKTRFPWTDSPVDLNFISV